MATIVEILLLEDVKGLGRFGQKKKVKMGYARNYLLPQELALLCTKANEARFESVRKQEEARRVTVLKEAQLLAQKIENIELIFSEKTHNSGRLYGSVGIGEILLALKQSHDIDIEKRAVVLPEPLKEVGTFSVGIALHQDVEVTLKVCLVSAEDK